jgi:hypothetical protein
MRQQEIYNQRAKEIQEERRRSQASIVKNDADVADDKDANKKSKKKKPIKPASSSKSAMSGGYNPMQPWTSSAGGGGYRYVIAIDILVGF